MIHGDLPWYWARAGSLSAANAFGTQLPDPINSGTGPMAYGGLNQYMDAAAEIGRNPVSKHQVQSEYENEKADAGRDYQTRLVTPNSQARTGTGKYSFSLFS